MREHTHNGSVYATQKTFAKQAKNATPAINNFLKAMVSAHQQLFELLYKEYYASLCMCAYKIIEDEQEAKDIVNALFSDLYDELFCYKQVEDIRHNLYEATRNRCIIYLKQKKKRRDAQNIHLESIARQVEHAELEAELIRAMYREVNKLPPQRKRIVEQLFFDNLSYGEVAFRMNLNPQTVRNQKVRAMASIRKALNSFF